MSLFLEAECRKHCSELVQSCNNGGSIIATLRHGYGQCDCDCSQPPGTSILMEYKSVLDKSVRHEPQYGGGVQQ